MARLNIDTGTEGNTATGDTLRTAMTKINTNFEEVYQSSEVQQGVFLIKDRMLRYQYYNQDLFTIIVKHDKYFLICDHFAISLKNLKNCLNSFLLVV